MYFIMLYYKKEICKNVGRVLAVLSNFIILLNVLINFIILELNKQFLDILNIYYYCKLYIETERQKKLF